MTREEAVDTLKKVKLLLRLYPKRKKQKETVSELNEAVDMAIEALKEDIVRCGECLHMKAECSDEGTCFYWCKHWDNATDSWGWCYYGERRKP